MMDEAERARLEKLLGMLSSSFDGERANAAGMIAAMAEKHKMTVVELINGAQPKPPPPPPPRPTPPPRPAQTWSNYGGSPRRRRGLTPSSNIQALSDIAENQDLFDGVLTEWEIEFAGDVSARYDRDYELSEKQLVVVERILRKAQRVAGGT